MTIPAPEPTTIGALAEIPAIAEAIEGIVEALRVAQSSIRGVRPPSPELAENYEAALARLTQTRGRPPFFPYLGSGLGRGALVQLADGSVKWDMISGIGVHAFGHSDPDLVATALRAALSDTVMQGNLLLDAEVVETAELLVQEAARGSRIRHCFLINSGALANEAALKVCFQKRSPADRVLAFRDAFAGRTTAMAQITDSAALRAGLPTTLDVDYVPFFDAERRDSTPEALRALDEHVHRYPGQHACFVMELVQGEGGFNIAPREFLAAIMQRCRELGILVWVDEIQTFGRTGEMFHYQQLELGEYVDVVTVGKLSQVCACLYTAECNPKPGLLSATFIGSTVALRVGRRIITRLRESGCFGRDGRNARLQSAFRQRAERLMADHPAWFPPVSLPEGRVLRRLVDGVGGMMRFTPFGGKRPRVMTALRCMYEDGVIAFYCGHDPYHVRFLPPVGVMEPRDFDDVFSIVEAALHRAARDEP
jgi:4-aminobutyrate aminotransferase-like enzyme